MQSERFTLNKEDLKRIAKGAGYAVGGALCAYLLSVLGSIDFGAYTPIVVAGLSIVLNAGIKFFSGK